MFTRWLIMLILHQIIIINLSKSFHYSQVQSLQVHKSIDDLKKQINPDILPKEYGGKVPLADMIGNYYYF